MTDAGSDPLVGWFPNSSTSLETLDPEASVDDLAAREAMVTGARVVAIGDNSHFIPEFTRLRHRVQRRDAGF